MALLLIVDLLMNNDLPMNADNITNAPTRMLCWQFERDHRRITCQLEATPSSFDVSTLPHWDLNRTAVEQFDAPAGRFAP